MKLLRAAKSAAVFVETAMNRVFLLFKGVSVGKGTIVKGLVRIRNRGSIHVGSGVRLNSRMSANPIGGDSRMTLVTGPDGVIIIGDGAAISNTAIVARTRVEIGKNVFIGGSAKIYDTDFHSIDARTRLSENGALLGGEPVIIEDEAFIGAFAIILKGVRVGSGAVIGAGSVVAADVPAGEIWAGNPARKVKRIESS